MKRLKFNSLAWGAIICTLLFLPVLTNVASAQSPDSSYYVTVKPALSDSNMYTAAGRNITITFQAIWTYGPNAEQPIQNATAEIKVTNRANENKETLAINTTTGTFSFNYFSALSDILTFTPTKLTTADGKDWKTGLVDLESNVYSLKAESAVVSWDSFHVSLLSFDTGRLAKVGVKVNVTYLLLPEEGLTLPAGASYNNASFLPKIAEGINVTINGVKAEETKTPGVYTADSSTFLPTAYVNVKVSQELWSTTSTGFSFAQNSNQQLWLYGVVFLFGFTLVASTLNFFKSKKANNRTLVKNYSYPFLGGILLAVTSTISLYWGIVGLEGTLHTFDWLALTSLGILTFVFGIGSSLMAIRKKNQALAIFAINIPLIMNLVVVKASFDIYGLTNPWMIFVISVFMSIFSGYFLGNSDEDFKQTNSQKKIELPTLPENPEP
jgi:hypothetical protein